MSSQRITYLENLADYVLSTWGPAGTAWLRAADRAPLKPVGSMRPRCTVLDAGQRNVDGGYTMGDDGEASSERELSVQLVFQLGENWTRVSNIDDWSDRIETVIAAVSRRLQTGVGVIEVRYVDDNPADLMWENATREAVWEVNFVVHYFIND